MLGSNIGDVLASLNTLHQVTNSFSLPSRITSGNGCWSVVVAVECWVVYAPKKVSANSCSSWVPSWFYVHVIVYMHIQMHTHLRAHTSMHIPSSTHRHNLLAKMHMHALAPAHIHIHRSSSRCHSSALPGHSGAGAALCALSRPRISEKEQQQPKPPDLAGPSTTLQADATRRARTRRCFRQQSRGAGGVMSRASMGQQQPPKQFAPGGSKLEGRHQ